jgi:hypothetical protein
VIITGHAFMPVHWPLRPSCPERDTVVELAQRINDHQRRYRRDLPRLQPKFCALICRDEARRLPVRLVTVRIGRPGGRFA